MGPVQRLIVRCAVFRPCLGTPSSDFTPAVTACKCHPSSGVPLAPQLVCALAHCSLPEESGHPPRPHSLSYLERIFKSSGLHFSQIVFLWASASCHTDLKQTYEISFSLRPLFSKISVLPELSVTRSAALSHAGSGGTAAYRKLPPLVMSVVSAPTQDQLCTHV